MDDVSTGGAEPSLEPSPLKETWWKRWRWAASFTIAALLFICIGGWILAIAPNELLKNWFPMASDDVRATSLWPAAQVVLFALGGVIAIVGIALSGARHGEELRAADRDRDRSLVQQRLYHLDREKEDNRLREAAEQRAADAEAALRSRLVTAVELLASDSSATKRMTGVYLLAGLVDEWTARRNANEAQVCLDVLCGYLRAAPRTTDDEAALIDIPVRTAGFDQIRTHLTATGRASPRWAGLHFNLAGATVHHTINLARIQCEGTTKLNLERIKVTTAGRILLPGARFAQESVLSLNGASIADGGEIHLQQAEFDDEARLTAAELDVARNGRLDLSDVWLRGNSDVLLGGPTIASGGEIRSKGLKVRDHAKLVINRAVVTGRGRLTATKMEAADHSSVSIGGATVRDSGQMNFSGLSVAGEAMAEIGKPRVEAGGRLKLDQWHVEGSGGIVVSEAQVGDRGLLSLSRGVADQRTVRLSVGKFAASGRVALGGIQLHRGAELIVRDAHWDEAGRVWMFADALRDAGSVFLGRIVLLGGVVAS